MSANRTDSEIVEWNDDGSRTHTIVYTEYPLTTKQKVATSAGLVALCFAPVVPLLTVIVHEKITERLEKRRSKRKLEAVTD